MPNIPKGEKIFTLGKTDEGKKVWTMTMIAEQDLNIPDKDFDAARGMMQKFLDEIAEVI